MKKFLLLILAILTINNLALAAEDKIVAIVNNEPITLSVLEQRKKIIRFLSNVPSLSAEQEKIFTKNALQTLIDDTVLFQYANKQRLKVTDSEVNNFIKYIETNNKIPEGQFEKSALSRNITRESFRAKMKIEVLRSKIVHEVVGQQVAVTRGDVDSLILDTNSRDANLSLKIFTSKNKSDKSYRLMSKLINKIRAKGCTKASKIQYKSYASLNETDATLSSLEPKIQGMVKDMSIGDVTDVIKSDDNFQVILLCGKTISSFSDDEINQVSQIVLQKQLNVKARKFLQTLRKKAYVKILI